jgi:S-adenosylmethionine hydrolase
MPGIPIISLTTDFGLSDPFVGSMKGVVLSINPRCQIVDLCHEVLPQNILHGAFLLSTSYSFLPKGSIHIGVVDPGVGTSRKAVLLVGDGHFFIAPDNGLLSLVLGKDQEANSDLQHLVPYHRSIIPPWRAYDLTNSRYWLHPVSSTFHGRDIFAPVASHLSLGVDPEELGTPIGELQCFYIPRPSWRDGLLKGHVLHVDRFGNLITDLGENEFAESSREVIIEVGGQRIDGLSPFYDLTKKLIALIGSHNYLEISVPRGSASHVLNVSIGDTVVVQLM